MNTIVIGSGLSGLMAAYISKKKGDAVTLITAGEGTLTQNSGAIDVFAYGEGRVLVKSPREAIANLRETHPYKKIGIEHIEGAVAEFLALMKEYGLPYVGSLDEIISVPTSVGTLKPTSFVPKSLYGEELFKAKKIIVVEIENLKDYFGDVLADNLKNFVSNAEFQNVTVNLNITSWRDITTIDAARCLENEENFLKFADTLKPYAKGNAVFLIPQILGTKDGELHKKITEILNAPVIETVCLPPSVNGIRVERIFRRALFEMGVNFVENARVLRGATDKGRVKAVVVSSMARDVKYEADKFILATGGFYGGGLTLETFNTPHEVIFRLPVWMPDGEENWSNDKLFSDAPQGFATAGILTDSALRPLDKHKNIIYDNLFVAGRNLGGYDFCFEHSGNGVAITSAYHAAMQEIKEG